MGQQRRDRAAAGQPCVLHRLLLERHVGVRLAERVAVLLVVEVLELDREPAGHRQTRTARFAFEWLDLAVAVAGERRVELQDDRPADRCRVLHSTMKCDGCR